MQPKLILDARTELGEGPAWDARAGVLYWVDILAGHLHIFNPQNGTDHSINFGEFLGCVAPCKSGGLVLGLRSGFAILASSLFSGVTFGDNQGPKVKYIVNPEAHLPGNRFNDGKCDPAGRFLAGTLNNTEQTPTGSLYSLTPDGMLKTLITGTRVSNGLAWSPDYHTFYYIDTPTCMIMAYDYDLTTGGIASPRPAITVPPKLGWPDGMTSDAEGMLWVAMWGGAKLTRWNPATGQLLETIPLPALNVSSCVFGGPDLNELYVTSARQEMSAAQLAEYPLSGGLFRIHTDIQGMPTFEFGG